MSGDGCGHSLTESAVRGMLILLQAMVSVAMSSAIMALPVI